MEGLRRIEACRHHPGSPALYRCEGCGGFLCGSCIEESYVLLLCRICGERAWPLDEDQPTTVQELEKARRRDGPYGLIDAFCYPFRAANLSLFLVVLICLSGIGILRIYFFFLEILHIPELLGAILWAMIVDLQYKIIGATADGDNDIPDWAEVTDLSSLVRDGVRVMAGDMAGLMLMGLSASWWIFHVLVILSFGNFAQGLPELLERSGLQHPVHQLGLMVALWFGIALAVMIYGSAGLYSRRQALLVHRHVRGFISAGGDAVWITNAVFFLGASVIFLQSLLGNVPLAGSAAKVALSAYWALVFPHLVGFLFRRHSTKMGKIYRTA